MSMSDYENAKQKISQYHGKSCFSGPKSTSSIVAAMERLKMSFPPTYMRFLNEYGAGGIGSFEIYGLADDNLDYVGIPNVIWYTEKARKEWKLPPYLIPIYDLGDGEVFCLDVHLINRENEEAPVIAYIPGFDLRDEIPNIVANDFGAFFLSLVEQEEKRIQK